MSKKWVMRKIDDISIPHWIIEEEVNGLPNTHKRVGFCDAQEDAELIIAAPRLQALAARRKKLLRRAHAMLEIKAPNLIELIEEIAKALGDE